MALRPLSRREDFRFPAGAYDVRGWEVRTEADDEKVGKVDDILLDAGGDLRYLDVDLGLFRKHVLVPLDRAHGEPDSEVVWIEGVSGDALEAIPEYNREPDDVGSEYARRLDAAWAEVRNRPVTQPPARPATAQDAELPLARLSEMADYRVSGDADPRGWKVVGADAEKIGEVRELLVDRRELRAAYLDCDVDEDRLELEPLDRHVLIPVERVRLDRGHKHVVVDGLLPRDLDDYPVYGGLPLTRDDAEGLERIYDRGGSSLRTEAREPDASARDRAAAESGHRHFFGRTAGDVDVEPDVREARHRFEDDAAAERHRAAAETVEEERNAADARRMAADARDEQVVREEDAATIRREDDEVRIRVSGDDIIIEKRRTD